MQEMDPSSCMCLKYGFPYHFVHLMSKNGTGNGGDMEVKEEETTEKHVESNVSSSRLPLLLSEKVHRTKALVECEGDSIDLSGDIGVVGRVIISDTPSGIKKMYLDLKGGLCHLTSLPAAARGIKVLFSFDSKSLLFTASSRTVRMGRTCLPRLRLFRLDHKL